MCIACITAVPTPCYTTSVPILGGNIPGKRRHIIAVLPATKREGLLYQQNRSVHSARVLTDFTSLPCRVLFLSYKCCVLTPPCLFLCTCFLAADVVQRVLVGDGRTERMPRTAVGFHWTWDGVCSGNCAGEHQCWQLRRRCIMNHHRPCGCCQPVDFAEVRTL